MSEWILSSSALMAALLLLRRLLGHRLDPSVRYALWALVLVRLLCPVSFFQSGLSIHNFHQPVIQQEFQPQQPEILPSEPQLPAPTEPLPSSPITPVPPEHSVPKVSFWGLWILGMGCLGLWILVCNGRFAARLRRSRQPLEFPVSPIPVFATSVVEVPCLYGLFRPAVYLDPETAEDPEFSAFVLTHELCHYRQLDHLWSALRWVALALHWYNPLAWLSFRASRQDGELSCDARALKLLGEAHRGDYGRMLVRLTQQPSPAQSFLAATSLTHGRKAMKERIVILMKHPKNSPKALFALALACLILVGCTFTGALESQPEETIPPESTTVPTTEPTEPIPSQIQNRSLLPLEPMLEGSAISYSLDGDTITLSEDGLILELRLDSRFLQHNGRLVGSMGFAPMVYQGQIYVHSKFGQNFLLAGQETPSLFHGMLFSTEEIQAALDDPDGSAFHRKLLAEVLLPSSMGITIPHVDSARRFQDTPLNEALIADLESRGIADASQYTYTEYQLLTGTLTQRPQNQADFDEETLAFLREKDIHPNDVWYLYKWFQGQYQNQSDQALKEALESCYRSDLVLMGLTP